MSLPDARESLKTGSPITIVYAPIPPLSTPPPAWLQANSRHLQAWQGLRLSVSYLERDVNGGFLGMGSDDVPIALKSFHAASDGKITLSVASKEALKELRKSECINK